MRSIGYCDVRDCQFKDRRQVVREVAFKRGIVMRMCESCLAVQLKAAKKDGKAVYGAERKGEGIGLTIKP